MNSSYLINSKRNITFQLQELPPIGTVLIMTITCVRDGDSFLSMQPNTIEWSASSPNLRVLSNLSLAETGTTGVNCTGVLSGNASGYEPFIKPVVVRQPVPLIITFPSSNYYPNELVPIVITSQFALDSQIDFLVTCAKSDSVATIFENQTTTTTRPADNDCLGRIENPFATLRANSNSLTVSINIRIPSTVEAQSSMVITIKVLTNGTDIILPDSIVNGTIRFRPRRWVMVYGLPDAIFEGDTTIIFIQIERSPDTGERLFVRIENNPSIEWLPSNPTMRNITLMLPSSTRQISVQVNASSAAQTNRYTLLNTSLQINLYTKIKVSTTSITSPQVLGEANAQNFSVTFSRRPLLQGCEVVPSYNVSTAGLLVFSPSNLSYGQSDPTSSLTKYLTVIGMLPASGLALTLTPYCNPRELESTSTSVVVVRNFTLVQLKRIYIESDKANLSRVIVGESNSEPLSVRLSDMPTSRSRLVLMLSFSDASVAVITPSTLTFTNTAQVQSVLLIGLKKGSGTIVGTIVEGTEYYPDLLGILAISVIDFISISVSQKGTVATQYPRVNSDVWSEWEVTVSDYLPGYSPTFEVSATAIDPALRVHMNLSATRITMTSPPTTYTLRLALACLSPTTVILSFAPPQRSEFKTSNIFQISLIPLTALNFSGAPSIVRVGSRNTIRATLNPITAPASTLTVAIDPARCNASVALVRQQSALVWTTLSFATAMNITFEGIGSGQCEISLVRRSAIFGSSIVYTTRQFIVTSPPAIFAANSTGSTGSGGASTSAFASLFSSVIGSTATTATSGSGDDFAFAFKTLRESGGTVNVVVVNGTFPSSKEFLSVVVINHGEPEPSGYDVVIESEGPEKEELGLAEVWDLEETRLEVTVKSSEMVTIELGPIPSLLIVAQKTLTIRFTSSAFAEKAYPTPEHESFTITFEPYLPTIVTTADSVVIQVVANLGVVAAIFGSPVGVGVAMQMYQGTWLLDCPVEDASSMDLPFGIRINRYDSRNFDNAVVVSACFVGVALAIFGIQFIIVAGYFLQRRRESSRTFFELAGRFRFPGLSFIAFFYVAQYASHFASLSVFTGDNVGHRVLAFTIVIFPVITVLIIIHGVVWRSKSLTFLAYAIVHKDAIERKRNKKAEAKKVRADDKDDKDDEKVSPLERIQLAFTPKGYWIHPTNTSYVTRWSYLFSETTGTHKWISLVYFIASLALGILSGLGNSANRYCVARTSIVSGIYGLLALSILLWRPFRYDFISAGLFIVHAMQCSAFAAIASEQRSDVRNDTVLKGGLRVIIAASVILMIVLITRAVLEVLQKTPSRDALLKACEAQGISTLTLDRREAEAKRGQLRQSGSGGHADTEMVGLNPADEVEAGELSKPILSKVTPSSPTGGQQLRVPLTELTEEDEMSIFASGFPHQEDADLYGNYTPVFVAEPIRGDEASFSPLRRAHMKERHALARQRRLEMGEDEMWIGDFVAKGGNMPLTSGRMPTTDSRGARFRDMQFDAEYGSEDYNKGGTAATDDSTHVDPAANRRMVETYKYNARR